MIQEQVNLQAYNTFGLAIQAKYFGAFNNIETLKELLDFREEHDCPMLILGGGSNVLLTKDFDGLVIRNEIGGIRVVKENDDHVVVESGAGVVWHEFVLHCIEKGWGGIENLSLIPGSVGASPMQNIGAYGVEIKDVFEQLSAYNLATGELESFDAEACAFGYRESVFKRSLKNQYVITSVQYRLSKRPSLNTSYGAIQSELEKMQVNHPSIQDVSKAVINIRQSKLPNPKEIGNAGSFFKNPVIDKEHAMKLALEFPGIPQYPVPGNPNQVKVAAGWLIEQAGFKGIKRGNYGVHDKQALVLVNHGGALGKDLLDLSSEIMETILSKFEIQLEREVNIV